MEDNLSLLYQDVILEHNRAPLFYEKRPDAQCVIEAYNPLCGDKFKLYIDIDGENIAAATFHGYGCAVSKASTSVLMRNIQGRALKQLPSLMDGFLKMVENGTESQPADPEMAIFLMAHQFPSRKKCAVLSWQALNDWMTNR